MTAEGFLVGRLADEVIDLLLGEWLMFASLCRLCFHFGVVVTIGLVAVLVDAVAALIVIILDTNLVRVAISLLWPPHVVDEMLDFDFRQRPGRVIPRWIRHVP